MKVRAVVFRPKPKVMLIQSAKLSPTVVQRILMTQNQTVISGTLLSIARWALIVSDLVASSTTSDRNATWLNIR